jgi:hypothetical protein
MIQMILSFNINIIKSDLIETEIRILCFLFTIKLGQTVTRLFHIQMKSIANHIVCDTI